MAPLLAFLLLAHAAAFPLAAPLSVLCNVVEIRSDAFKKVTNWGEKNILSARPQHTTYHTGGNA